jgi:cytochrome c oxidase cbb3-type subunit II
MTDFRKLVLTIAATFAAPWLLLIVWPAISYQSMAPIPYDKDKGDELDNAYSFPLITANLSGQVIYQREGCVQCHTQVIRPAQMALDGWRLGSGVNQLEGKGTEPTRATVIRDFFGEPHAFLGVQRNGPDLANAGHRFTNRVDVHMHLYAPKVRNDWSTAPNYTHLYTMRKVQGQGSDKALPLRATIADPGKDYEVVPTAEAELLVDYILSLKKDAPLPGSRPAVAAAKK